MLRLGKFTEAIQRGDERRSSLRKENATMYAEFVRENPGASVDERADFANNLINDTGVGSKGLPTRASMKRNVDKYKKAEATKAAAASRAAENRKQAAIRQRFTDIESIVKNAASLGQDQAYVEGILKEFGYETDGIDAIMTNVKDRQFQDWQRDNEAAITNYINNPTKAGYDLLLSRGGDFKENISTLFKSQYEAFEEKQSLQLKSDLEVLASAKDQADYDRQLRDLKNKYPDAVFDKVGPQIERTKSLFEGQMEAIVVEELRKMEVELRTLSSNESLTPAQFNDQKRAILAKYSEEAQDRAGNSTDDTLSLLAVTNDRADKMFDTVRANQTADWNARADVKLNSFVNAPGMTLDGLRAQIELLKSDGQAEGFILDADWGNEYVSTFEAKTLEAETKAANILAGQVDQAVSEQTDKATAAAAADTNLEEVVADIERKMTAKFGDGEPIVLTEDQRASIKAQIEAQKDQIKKNVASLGTGMENTTEGYQDTLNRTREEFIKDFAERLGTSEMGGLVNAEERFGAIAGETYDNIVAAVREQANRQEEVQIAKSVSEMNADRSDFDAGKAKDLFDERMVNPEVYGTGDPDERASIGAAISTSLFAQAQTFASETGIPLTEEVYTRFMNLLQASVAATHVPGQPFDIAVVKEKLQLAVQETFDTSDYSSIEREAYNRALVKAGIARLDEGSDTQLTKFRIEYEKLRTQLAEQKFDKFGSSFADDVERSVPLMTASDNIVTGNTDALNIAIGQADQLLALNGRDFVTSEVSGELIASKRALDPIPGKLEIAAYDLKSEIRRLTALQRTDVYKNSKNKPAVVAKIEELTAALTKVNDQSRAISDFMVRFDEVKRKGQQENANDKAKLEEASEEMKIFIREQQRNAQLLGGPMFNKEDFFNLEVPPGYEDVEDFANTYQGRAWKALREKGLLSLQ